MMDSIQFHPLFPWPVVASATIVVLAFLFILEWKRKSRHIFVNIALQLILVIALLGLVSRPFVEKEIKSEAVILLTPNYDRGTVDSLVTALITPQIVYDQGVTPYPKSIRLKNLDLLTGREVIIVGEGIPAYDLVKIHASSFVFFQPKKETGIQSLHLDKQFTVNRLGNVKGSVVVEKKNSSLRLRGPEGVLDSALYTHGSKSFDFKFRPKVPGHFVYQLDQQDSVGALIFSEPVPISVFPDRKLNILMLQDFPTVEQRFLKNYLGEKGHHLAIRYGVTKNIDRAEFINRSTESLNRITSAVLAQFDLLMMSASAFDNLPASTQRVFEQANQAGLGILMVLEEVPSRDIKELLPLEFLKADQDTIQLTLDGGNTLTLPVAPLRIQPEVQFIPLLSNRNNIVEGFVSRANGKIGFQLLNETYPLLLSGKESEYAQIWIPLLEEVARTAHSKSQLKIETPFPWYKDEPIDIQVVTQEASPELIFEGEVMPLLEDPRIDGIWRTTIWPGNAGWNSLSLPDDSTTLNFYVPKEDEWSSLRMKNQRDANQFYNLEISDLSEHKKREDEISPLLFFLIFLFASGALWLLPKV